MMDGRQRKLEKYIPLDLCMNILARLPVKNLLRFRTVSKTWCSIIDDSEFSSMHLSLFNNNHLNNNNKRLMFNCGHEVGSRFISCGSNLTFLKSEKKCLPRPNFVHYSRLSNCAFSCHVDGLLLMRPCRPVAECEIIICNPSIRKYLKIPPIPSDNSTCYDFCTLLGYDALSDDYKVVSICLPVRPSNNPYFRHAVYALKTRCWRVQSRCEDYLNVFGRMSRHRLWDFIMTKGFAHWLACEIKDSTGSNYTHILSYDFASETFSSTRLPDAVGGCGGGDIHGSFAFPFCLKDSFALFSMSPRCCSIWVMGKCGILEPWSQQEFPFDSFKKWRGNISHISVTRNRKNKESGNFILGQKEYLSSYQFFKDNEFHIMRLVYVEKDHKFLFFTWTGVKSYDMENHEIKDVMNYRIHDHYYINTYVESLLLSKGVDSQSFPQEGEWCFSED